MNRQKHTGGSQRRAENHVKRHDFLRTAPQNFRIKTQMRGFARTQKLRKKH